MKTKQEMMEQMLFEAIDEMNEHDVVALLRLGVDPNAKDSKGFRPLHRATDKDADIIAKILIESGADVNYYDDEILSPLQMAVRTPYDSMKVAKILMESGADVNIVYEEMNVIEWGLYCWDDNGYEIWDYRGKPNVLDVIEFYIKERDRLKKIEIEGLKSIIRVEMNNVISDLLDS